MDVTLGGDRLGAGKKNKIYLHNYERSTHDLSHIFRSSAAAGTLIPFLTQVGLPGDTFDIDLDADVKTIPTLGPLFGSFKLQLDVFMCPIRLYNGILHNNMLGIGMNMSEVKLPQFEIELNALENDSLIDFENQQINQSSLLAYLGLRGGGASNVPFTIRRNAVPMIAYYDIYKNYYVNKQEEDAFIVHNPNPSGAFDEISLSGPDGITNLLANDLPSISYEISDQGSTTMHMTGENISWEQFSVLMQPSGLTMPFQDLFMGGGEFYVDEYGITTIQGVFKTEFRGNLIRNLYFAASEVTNPLTKLAKVPLKNFDDMRQLLLTESVLGAPYIIDKYTLAPYGSNLYNYDAVKKYATSRMPQQGLAIKTYQSDLFNNWVNTDWIDGDNGISELTSIDVVGNDGYLNLDSLNLAQKVYNMLNRIAVSGGSYNDWMSAVYGHEGIRQVESPVYLGGLSSEIVFQEVVSNAATVDDPLGTLAGKGTLNQKRKGGKVVVRCDEPCYIMGIASITPRIDYSQGNNWDTRLENLDDFHKPALDGIGFQELLTEQMCYLDTWFDNNGVEYKRSVGKQPAWINYMTAVNRTYGNFADAKNQMFMTLNRRYEFDWTSKRVKDLTTYIDPTKFNYAFAVQDDLTAQHFWLQIAMDITARRKMSAKQIPNL